MAKQQNVTAHGVVELFRGQSPAADLFSALGDSLRETRLTAAVGYVMAGNPGGICEVLGIRGRPNRLLVEQADGGERADIILETDKETAVFEAKVDQVDPVEQIRRYALSFKRPGKRLRTFALVPFAKDVWAQNEVTYLPWQTLSAMMSAPGYTKKLSPVHRAILGEVQKYMERHGLVRNKIPKEVYAREINDEGTLDLFLKHHFYQCKFERQTQLMDASYFAPHFGAKIESLYGGITHGISHVAKINSVVVAEDEAQYREAVVREKGRAYLKRHEAALMYPFKEWGPEKRYLVFTSQPLLVFNPPIEKSYLQKGSGWLSKRAYSFEDLFKAMHRQSVA